MNDSCLLTLMVKINQYYQQLINFMSESVYNTFLVFMLMCFISSYHNCLLCLRYAIIVIQNYRRSLMVLLTIILYNAISFIINCMSKPSTPAKKISQASVDSHPSISKPSENPNNPNIRTNFLYESKQLEKDEGPSNQVVEAKQKLDDLIQDLNGKLVNHFKVKQEALLNQYKRQLIEQQKTLNELKNNTNEEQIKAKMLQRKNQLEKQRNHLIQTNMFFSQKCQQYKQNYSQLVQEAQDMQREIKFLDQQIDAANAKRISMIEEAQKQHSQAQHKGQLPLYTEKKIYNRQQDTQRSGKDQPTIAKTNQTSSMRKITKSLHASNFSKNTKSKGNLKNQKSVNPQIFEKGVLEKLFQESVEQVKNRRKTKRTMPNLKGEEFTEYEKRAIMEIFLSNEEVKKKIYEIIFENNDKTGKGLKADPMIKISFEEIGM